MPNTVTDEEVAETITDPAEMEDDDERDDDIEDESDVDDDDDDTADDHEGAHPDDDVDDGEDDDDDQEDKDQSKEPDSIQQLTAQVQAQQQQMNQLIGMVAGNIQQTPEQLAQQTARKTDAELRPGLVTKDEFNSMFDSHEHFNSVLGKKLEGHRDDTIKTAVNAAMSHFRNQQAQTELRKEFYRDYPELHQYSDKLVAPVADSIQQEHPEWSLQQIFSETGSFLYDKLGYKQKGTARKPGLAPTSKRGRRGRRKPKQSSGSVTHDQVLNDLIDGKLAN